MAPCRAVAKSVATHRIFAHRPAPLFIDAVRAHISRTGQPETFPDLHQGPIRRDEPFHRLARIKVAQEKRPNSDMAPCPMCHPDKFLDGWLVYCFELGAAAFIGHCCASRQTRVEADKEWAERQARDREEGYLLAVLPQLSEWLDTFHAVRPSVEEARRLFRAFRSEGATFYQALRAIRANAGRLVATEIMRGAAAGGPTGLRTRGSSYQTRDIEFGILAGMTAVLSDYNPVRTLDEIVGRVVPHVQADEEAALTYIVDRGPAHRAAAYKELRKAARDFAVLVKALDDFRAFFTPANLTRITEWASHPDAPVGFKAHLAQPNAAGERPLTFDTRGTYFNFKIKPALWRATGELALREPEQVES